MNKKFPIIGFAILILLTSGCINTSEINEFALEIMKTGNNKNGEGADVTDNIIDIITPPDIVVTDPETPKLSPPYLCDKKIIKETLNPLFEPGMKVSRISSFGGPINLTKCNIVVNFLPIIQFEFVKQESFEKAFDFMRDQERQYLAQIKDFERKVESITPNSLSFTSKSTGENRIIFIVDNPIEPVVVKVKSFPGDTASVETVREVSVALELLLQ